MMTTKTKKLKVIPGRSVSGKDIRARLNNKTLLPQQYTNEDYSLNEDMARFRKLSKVEQINLMRENQKKIEELQSKLDQVASAKKQKMLDAQIEREVQERIKKMNKDATSKDQKPNEA